MNHKESLNKKNMTSDNIKKVQILAELDNGEHILAVSDNSILIKFIVEFCQFIKIDEAKVDTFDIKDIIEKGDKK